MPSSTKYPGRHILHVLFDNSYTTQLSITTEKVIDQSFSKQKHNTVDHDSYQPHTDHPRKLLLFCIFHKYNHRHFWLRRYCILKYKINILSIGWSIIVFIMRKLTRSTFVFAEIGIFGTLQAFIGFIIMDSAVFDF